MSTIETLIVQTRQEAERETFPIDVPIYESAQKEPHQPILYAGNLESPVCFFGRDLGRDEVHAGQPLIGAAGKLVRGGFFQMMHQRNATSKEDLNSVCDRILLANTVPYKPPGNKAYTVKVKERFRPFVARLLVFYWQGNQLITLGTEAFKWFAPYGRKGEVNDFFKREERFSEGLPVILTATDEQGLEHQRKVTLLPLPHPSPLNKKYYAKFPEMLQQRLNELEF
ncbi:MAG: uracil-DNA glycosylase family protein [Microcystaceae cyanobacterium]